MQPCLLQPYPEKTMSIKERIANYRLSCARRIVENTFGIATARFCIFRRAMCVNPDTETVITKAIIALHKYVMKSKNLRGILVTVLQILLTEMSMERSKKALGESKNLMKHLVTSATWV